MLGIVERGGEVITRVIPDRSSDSVIPHHPRACAARRSRIVTDEARAFRPLGALGYRHATVNHAEKEYVRGDFHTNTIEAFWAMVKRTIAGTHIWVSPKHLPKYLGEIEFRWNLRKHPELMFPVLLASFLRPLPSSRRLKRSRVAFGGMLFREAFKLPGAACFFKAEIFAVRH